MGDACGTLSSVMTRTPFRVDFSFGMQQYSRPVANIVNVKGASHLEPKFELTGNNITLS
jgi:hypothetical protein